MVSGVYYTLAPPVYITSRLTVNKFQLGWCLTFQLDHTLWFTHKSFTAELRHRFVRIAPQRLVEFERRFDNLCNCEVALHRSSNFVVAQLWLNFQQFGDVLSLLGPACRICRRDVIYCERAELTPGFHQQLRVQKEYELTGLLYVPEHG